MKEQCSNRAFTKCINSLLILAMMIAVSCSSSTRSGDEKPRNVERDTSTNAQNPVLGNWVCVKELYRNVGRYGPKHVDSVKRSVLVIEKDKIYIPNFDLDTLRYQSFAISGFFDDEDRNESSYVLDGPLAVHYWEDTLRKFKKIQFVGMRARDQYNCLNRMYLHHDTLIFSQCGGVTFFFVRKY